MWTPLIVIEWVIIQPLRFDSIVWVHTIIDQIIVRWNLFRISIWDNQLDQIILFKASNDIKKFEIEEIPIGSFLLYNDLRLDKNQNAQPIHA